MVVSACNLSNLEAEAEGFQAQAHPGLHSETPTSKKKKQTLPNRPKFGLCSKTQVFLFTGVLSLMLFGGID
jgi:hypothetical protein